MNRITGGLTGIESISAVAETTGEHRIEVRVGPVALLPGRYEVRIKELRDAVPLDRRRVAAEAALVEGWRLWAPQTDEAERRALARIASIHNTLFELPAAIEHNRQALVLTREVGDRAQEINVLFQMAQNAVMAADWQQAQDRYRQAIASLLLGAVRPRRPAITVSTLAPMYI